MTGTKKSANFGENCVYECDSCVMLYKSVLCYCILVVLPLL